MNTVKLIRYANEGFQNHLQKHLHTVSREPIVGCYAFVEHVYHEFLVFSDSSMGKNRNLDAIHEAWLSPDTLVYVRNMKLPSQREHIYISKDKEDVFIPLEPIEKEYALNRHMSIPLALEAYVKAPIGFVKEQLTQLLSIYEWLEKECGARKDTTSINTQIIDFAEVIVNAEYIVKGKPRS